MNLLNTTISQRERELAAIISAYNEVTEQLKVSHERLNEEVRKLRWEVEKKNQELARRERLAALGEMAAGVAHEIRNPLGGIRLYASLLDRDLKALPECQKLVCKIASGVESMEKIVGDVLNFASCHEPRGTRVPLQLMVCNVCDLAGARAQGAGVELVMDTSILDHVVWVDQVQIERALLNIVYNGIDACGPGGRVCFSVRDSEQTGFVELCVCDEGCGFDPQVIERVFDPFFTTKDDGTGLGLAIVHSIVEGHGGRLQARNRPDGGACLIMRLPMDEQNMRSPDNGAS